VRCAAGRDYSPCFRRVIRSGGKAPEPKQKKEGDGPPEIRLGKQIGRGPVGSSYAGELEGMRDAIAAWLGRERRLELKVAGARPRRATRTHAYLGYRVSRAGIRPGERMRIRARENLARSAEDPERLRSSLASLGTAWMFGS